MTGRRNKLQIIIDILTLLQEKEKVKPTHLLYKGNLSYDRLKKYLTELEDKGLIMVVKEKDKTFYKLTDKGYNFVMEAKKIKELTEAFGL